MAPSPRLLRAHQVLAAVIAVSVVLLALLAGRFLFLGDLVIETHGYIGNGVFALTVVNLAVVLALRADALTIGVAGLLALLVFAQVGLGYVGRETLDAAALHIPNGVLLMGLAGFQLANTRALRPAS